MSDTTSPGDRLLDGIRVLDLSRVMSGPFCTAMLADLGAEVIKIERPESGDDGRHFGPYVDGESAYFMLLNRNKKSMTLNLKSERGRELLRLLAGTSDVLVENFRPGVAKRLGIGYAALEPLNPGLVYASISGFGQEGPLAGRPAYDPVVQAMSGIMDVTGQRDGPPTAVGESISDVCAGMFAAWGITTALFARERTGRGRYLDTPMLDSVFAMMLTVLGLELYTDRTPRRAGNRHPVTYPVDSFATRDGYAVIVVSSDRAFRMFSEAIGRPDLAENARFLTNADRNAHEGELRTIIEKWTRRRTKEEVVAAMDAARIPAAPVLSVADVTASPHIAARGMIFKAAHPVLGDIPLVRQPVRFSGTDRGSESPPPALGEHTRELLAALLGLADSEIDTLAGEGII